MPAFKGCQADGRFIDCEECHDEEVIVCSKPKEAKACEG